MAKKESLREHLNRKLKEKGATLKAEKAKAKKYKSISAAKKGGSLYYTDKNGKVMAAVYATDLKEIDKLPGVAISPRPVLRGDKPKPKTKPKNLKPAPRYEKTPLKPVPKINMEDDMKAKLQANKGGMMKKKSAYKAGGMAMVTDPKTGKKIPAFAADGKGKMNKGGMAKKKPAAKMMHGGMAKKKTGAYMYGGMAKKKKK